MSYEMRPNGQCEPAEELVIALTASEAEALMNHLEWYILQEIKDDSDYDSIDYLISLVHVYEKCKVIERRKNNGE